MKKLFKYTSPVFILLFLFAAFGCEKDANLSKEEMLTSHVWRFSEITATTNNQDVLDLLQLAEALMTGGTITFNKDGTYTMTIMQQTEDGTWELSVDETTLIMDKGTGDEDEATLASLTLSRMVWESEDDYQGEIYTVSVVWIQ